MLLHQYLHLICHAGCYLVLVQIITVATNNAHQVKAFKLNKSFQKWFQKVEHLQTLAIQLRFVLVLVRQSIGNDAIVRLTDNGNQEVEQDDEIHEQVEEPDEPDQVHHQHWVTHSRVNFVVMLHFFPVLILWRTCFT